MTDILHGAHDAIALIAHCSAVSESSLFGIAAALASVGLVGSFAHCAPMCGPFVLMQLPDNRGLAVGRRAAGLLPAYQLGRMTTYVALGAVVGGVGHSIGELAPFQQFLRILLGLAAAAFLLQAVKLAFPRLAHAIAPASRHVPWLTLPVTWLIRATPGRALSGFRLGLALGLLPCGFLYAALLASAATGSAVAGAVAMAAFALGTMPALAAVGLLGASVVSRWRGFAARLAAPLFLFNALVLAALAMDRLT
jgi:sulfite exporter TauE/SafE